MPASLQSSLDGVLAYQIRQFITDNLRYESGSILTRSKNITKQALHVSLMLIQDNNSAKWIPV
jgi:hypothetical protein